MAQKITGYRVRLAPNSPYAAIDLPHPGLSKVIGRSYALLSPAEYASLQKFVKAGHVSDLTADHIEVERVAAVDAGTEGETGDAE